MVDKEPVETEEVETDEIEDVEDILEEVRERNVKEILVEMKDKAELIIDLAYSAILYDNEELADDVFELEEDLNTLKYEVEIMSMVAARTPEDAAQLTAIMRVAQASEEIANAARELADVVKRDVELHPVLRNAIKEADETIVRMAIGKKSEMIGKSLDQLKLATKTGMQIFGLRRGTKWINKVGKKTIIQGNDVVIARGPREGVEPLKKLADFKLNKK